MFTRRDTFSWALYDFANSSFTTLVVTFIYSAYFTQKVASDPDHGTVLWSRAVNLSALIVALSMPLLGAIADSSGRKKFFLMITTVLCVIPTGLLFFPGPGRTVEALALFVIANIGFEAGIVFYNSFLPEVSTRETIGRVSGFGQALGYAGGLISLFIALWMVKGGTGLPIDVAVRSTNVLVAVWFAIFAVPIFLFVREERVHTGQGVFAAARDGFRRLHATLGHMRSYREAAKLMLARLVYNDGLVTVFSFAGIFAAATFGMTTEDLVILGIGLNVAAGIGSFGFGWINDAIGGKKTIIITLVLLIVATALGATAQTRTSFWVAAIILGIMVGPNQSASRSLLGLFVPSHKHAEFFGFFAFSGKLASVLGPLVYGTALEITGSQRWAMGSIGVFFIVGLVLIAFVDEARGVEAAV